MGCRGRDMFAHLSCLRAAYLSRPYAMDWIELVCPACAAERAKRLAQRRRFLTFSWEVTCVTLSRKTTCIEMYDPILARPC